MWNQIPSLSPHTYKHSPLQAHRAHSVDGEWHLDIIIYVSVCVCLHVCVYMCVCVHVCVCVLCAHFTL